MERLGDMRPPFRGPLLGGPGNICPLRPRAVFGGHGLRESLRG